MAALTLEEWRDRTLEQVHFAAEAALNAVVVQGNPSIRQYVAAMATGDLNQCLARTQHRLYTPHGTRDGHALHRRPRVRDHTGPQGCAESQ